MKSYVLLVVGILTILSPSAWAVKEGGGGDQIKKDFQDKATIAIQYLRRLSLTDIDVEELESVATTAKIEATPMLSDSDGKSVKNQQYRYAFSFPGTPPRIQLRMRSDDEAKGSVKDMSWQGMFDAKQVGLDDIVHELFQASKKYSGADDGYQITRNRLGLNKISPNVLNPPDISFFKGGDYLSLTSSDHTRASGNSSFVIEATYGAHYAQRCIRHVEIDASNSRIYIEIQKNKDPKMADYEKQCSLSGTELTYQCESTAPITCRELEVYPTGLARTIFLTGKAVLWSTTAPYVVEKLILLPDGSFVTEEHRYTEETYAGTNGSGTAIHNDPKFGMTKFKAVSP